MYNKMIKILSLVSLLLISNSLLAADDFTFSVPLQLDHLTEDVKRAGVLCYIYDQQGRVVGSGQNSTSVSRGLVDRTVTVKANYGYKTVRNTSTPMTQPPEGTAHDAKKWMCRIYVCKECVNDSDMASFLEDSGAEWARAKPGTELIKSRSGNF